MRKRRDHSDHKSFGGAGAARVGGKSASLINLEGLLGVLASLQEIPGKLPHLEEGDFSGKQPAICRALSFFFFYLPLSIPFFFRYYLTRKIRSDPWYPPKLCECSAPQRGFSRKITSRRKGDPPAALWRKSQGMRAAEHTKAVSSRLLSHQTEWGRRVTITAPLDLGSGQDPGADTHLGEGCAMLWGRLWGVVELLDHNPGAPGQKQHPLPERTVPKPEPWGARGCPGVLPPPHLHA